MVARLRGRAIGCGGLKPLDPSTGEIQTEIPMITGQVAALSPDGRRAAAQQHVEPAGPTFGPVRVHDLETGKVVATMQGWCVWVDGVENPKCRKAPKTPFQEWVYSLDFSPDGALLAAGGLVSGSLSVWNATTGELLHKTGEDLFPNEFSPDGKLLASGDADGVVKLWDVRLGK